MSQILKPNLEFKSKAKWTRFAKKRSPLPTIRISFCCSWIGGYCHKADYKAIETLTVWRTSLSQNGVSIPPEKQKSKLGRSSLLK